MTPVNSAPLSRPKMMNLVRIFRLQLVDQNVDPDVDAGAHAVGRAELGHPDEHVDAQFLRPAQLMVSSQSCSAGQGIPDA